MSSLFFLFLLHPIRSYSMTPPRAADVCIDFLNKRNSYSLVLRGEDPFVLLKQSLPSKSVHSFARILSRAAGQRAIIREFPALSNMAWVKRGQWIYSASPVGLFGQIVRYDVNRDGFFGIEMKLDLGEKLNEEVIRCLLNSLELEKVSALVSGIANQISVDRLDLNDLRVRAALRTFFAFLKSNEENSEYVRAIGQIQHF